VRGRETNQNVFRERFGFVNVTSSLGYIRQVSERSTFRTNVGTAWRTPNMAELYSFGQHGFKTSFGLLRYYTNSDGRLKTDRVIPIRESNVIPERGYKWINEWKTQLNTSTYTLTFYSHYIQNFIFDRPIAVIGTIRGPMPVFIFDQADAIFVGADFSWQKKWTPSLRGNFGVSYLWSENLEKNETLINQPPITTSYKLVWEPKNSWIFSSSQFSVRPSYTFRQFQAPRTVRPDQLIEGTVVVTPESEIFDLRDAPEGYFLMDVAWRFELGQFNAGVSVQNVFNASYRSYLNEMRYFADELGRNVLFTLSYQFNTKPN
ncbi:MAG: TonB-dependent receptor, partial [Bacteroidota bacterium]